MTTKPQSRQVRRAIVCASGCAILGMFASSQVWAQAIPLPRPSPRPRAVVQLPAPEPRMAQNVPAPAPPAVQPRVTTPPNPVIPDPRRNVPANIFSTFDAGQKAAAGRLSAYLSGISFLSGNFVQVSPSGARSKGDFYIQKPGKVRFEYDAPSDVAMISDGSSLVVRDNKLATQDIYPLSQTPLRYLLADKIDLLRDTNVVAIAIDELYISVTIEEKSPIVGTSRLMLMLGVKDNLLKQWTVTDPQGYDTTVAIYNLDTTRRPDPSMFKIDFTKYPSSPGNN